MSRNMKAANGALFRHLESFCAHRGEPIPSAGAVRYVEGDADEGRYLRELKLGPSLRFGQRRSISRLRYVDRDLIALVGFEFEIEPVQLTVTPNNAGLVVCLLSELRPQP